MEFQTNQNAIYCDPNAYVQSITKKETSNTKKVVFQEPYECLPNRYIDNNFHKHNCQCVPKSEPPKCEHNKPNTQGFPFGLDIKSLLPLLSAFGGKGAGLESIISMLGKSGNGGGMDVSSLLSSFLGSKNAGGLLGGLFKKPQKKEHNIKSTDIPIKEYTRVD